jgi:hypothetical protein
MKIIGCDFHPGYQQIAVLDQGTGEMVEKALSHERIWPDRRGIGLVVPFCYVDDRLSFWLRP